MSSRRDFLRQASAVALGLPSLGRLPGARAARRASAAGFIDVRRPPDAVMVQTAEAESRLAVSGSEWRGDGVTMTTREAPGALAVRLSAPGVPIKRLHLRWRGDLAAVRLVLGDAWERGYGDLEWRGSVPDRAMPWYAAAFDGQVTHAWGVRTGPAAFCYWQCDPHGISLFADVRSGGSALQLGSRALDVCEVVCRQGRGGESAFAALHAFCREMCAAARRPGQPVYGTNDWYWAYGRNSAETILNDARRIVELSPSGDNHPLAVIDDGWQPQREDKTLAGLWDRGNARFGDMATVAAQVRAAGARPGIWVRPLLAPAAAPDVWRLSRDRAYLDPTVPEARQKIADDMTRLRGWGFELIKHDYTTFDLFGRWGFQMGTAMTREGWTFAAGSDRTTAEVILELYRTIREAAGDTLIIGCNTVSHLSAGVFDICRVGDDTSGTEWARTRKMGVNTLAFRGVQHDAFYAADADCVGVTKAVPWRWNRLWLDLVARSGTAVFVSLAPDAVGPEETRDLRAALARAARRQPLGEPLDWQATVWPSRWRLGGQDETYDWIGADGAGGAA